MFCTLPKTNFYFSVTFILSSANAFILNLCELFPKRQILDSPKLKEFADNNFEFYENGRKFLMRIESTVGKGELAHYEQFLIFPQCFLKTYTADTFKKGLVWKRVKVKVRSVVFVRVLLNITLWRSLKFDVWDVQKVNSLPRSHDF